MTRRGPEDEVYTGWFTPAYLAALDADVILWCDPAFGRPCAYRMLRTHEALAATYGPGRDLTTVRYVCPACQGTRYTTTLLLRATARPGTIARITSPYAARLALDGPHQ